MFRTGCYEEAIEGQKRIETPEAAFVLGIAYFRNWKYRDGVRTRELDPDDPGVMAFAGNAIQRPETPVFRR